MLIRCPDYDQQIGLRDFVQHLSSIYFDYFDAIFQCTDQAFLESRSADLAREGNNIFFKNLE